jgi:hypothetical protein
MSTALAAALLAAGLRLAASHDTGPHRADFARWDGDAAYAEGAPPGFSGGFREDSCHACHFHAELNAAPGTLTIDGIPARFAPGERYSLTVTLTRAGMKRAGFQLAVRFKDKGAQAGSLEAGRTDGERVKIENAGGIQYAGHRLAGSTIADADTTRWGVDWVAPAGGGPVIFSVAANAADGDERVDGDFVYTAAVEAAPASGEARLIVADDPSVEQLNVTLRVVQPSRVVRHHHHRRAVAMQLSEHLPQRVAGF